MFGTLGEFRSKSKMPKKKTGQRKKAERQKARQKEIRAKGERGAKSQAYFLVRDLGKYLEYPLLFCRKPPRLIRAKLQVAC